MSSEARVQYYWIVGSAARTFETFELEKGLHRLVAAWAEDENFQPALFPNLTISLDELWE